MSSSELAETVMEFMDAKDEQWKKELSFRDMYVYYHIKGTCKRKQLSPPKRGQYGLRVVIDYLEKRGILGTVKTGQSFTLTSKGLDVLLEHIIPKVWKGGEPKGMIDYGKVRVGERKQEIRRYTVGDVFRDISVRHTLREIVRQKKKLSDIDRRDFRVFVKQHRRLQSDIVLCVDSSGSMGFRQKLIYARLVAAGLARAALEKGGRVGIVTFDDFSRSIMPLTNVRQEAFDYIVGINAGGNTNIGDGIECAAQLLLHEPNHNQKHIVLISDGLPSAISEEGFTQMEPTKGSDLAEEFAILETRRASSKGVKTSVVHITNGKEGGEKFVQNIARIGKGQVRRISSLNDMKAII
ncbi:VWA domain-containing protein [Chloroflexota bacterium]